MSSPSVVGFRVSANAPVSPSSIDQMAAIDAIRDNFLDASFTHDQRAACVEKQRVALVKEDPNYLLQLFEKLPKETWPLVFVHFGEAIYQGVVHNGQQPGFMWSEHQGPDESVLISYCRDALLHSINNPRLEHAANQVNPSELAVAEVCRTASAAKIIECVLHRFFEAQESVTIFFPCMKHLARAYKNQQEQGLGGPGEFIDILQQALDHLKEESLPYLLKVMQRSWLAQPTEIGGVPIVYELWKKLLQKPYDCAAVTLNLIQAQRLEFLENRRNTPFDEVITTLCIIHPNLRDSEFLEWLKVLPQLKQTPWNRVVLLRHLCALYEAAGCAVVSFLNKHQFLSVFQPWFDKKYDVTVGDLIFSDVMGLKLLYCFYEVTFAQRVLDRINLLFSVELDQNNLYQVATSVHGFFLLARGLGEVGVSTEILEMLKANSDLWKRIHAYVKFEQTIQDVQQKRHTYKNSRVANEYRRALLG